MTGMDRLQQNASALLEIRRIHTGAISSSQSSELIRVIPVIRGSKSFPTHFHAIYGEHEALIEIETGRENRA